jgi:peptide/nickel transport system permease protein
MSPNHVVYRVLASAPLLIAVLVVAAFAGAGLSVMVDALTGAVITGLVLGLGVAVGVGGGVVFGTRAVLAESRWAALPVRGLASAHGALPALAPAAALAALAIGRDPIAAWIAYCLPALAYGAWVAVVTLDGSADQGFVLAALGRGVSRRDVFRRHALPLTLARAAEGIGPLIGMMTASAAVVERFADVNGAGALCARAVARGDVGATTAGLAGLIAVAVAIDAAAIALVQRWLPRKATA